MTSILKSTMILLCVLSIASCQKVYFNAMEKVGVHKRDILVDRVEEARDSQAEAKEEFANALERFASVVNFDGGELQTAYARLNASYENCKDQADTVTSRINKVEEVAKALFVEWEQELTQYSNANLRNQSANQLRVTQIEYRKMLAAMRKAEKTMPPVLDVLRDQVLFLKHNLNARAVASIKTELATVQRDVSSLITQMERSIAEAEQFISQMQKS
jgi:hypothetical protein